LETDLVSLEAYTCSDLPPLIADPYISKYALYLETLPRHTLLSHWFGLVYPYIQIPDQGCLVDSLVPDAWLKTNLYFNIEDDLWLRKGLEDEIAAWRSLERYEFFAESIFACKLYSHSFIECKNIDLSPTCANSDGRVQTLTDVCKL
jgi:hypothetical protein